MSFYKKNLHEKIKNELIFYVNNIETIEKQNVSKYLTDKFFLSKQTIYETFIMFEKISIKHFIIKLKIERSKQMLIDGKRTSEIWRTLDYSSIGHFSNQFKKIVGLSPKQFATLKFNLKYKYEYN